ncbi:hypothetical protein [Ehrlichia japonica]|uniref:Uncharacterized protein n=1 Tax=Ehrlichia japonica TaxID=391036 RepID=X5GB12_9RICK|nr:hypothetical protein [Ehrlichia japonica]AHX04292.1 hypothetical protein EHF_0233 [Ehrlichia japonica]
MVKNKINMVIGLAIILSVAMIVMISLIASMAWGFYALSDCAVAEKICVRTQEKVVYDLREGDFEAYDPSYMDDLQKITSATRALFDHFQSLRSIESGNRDVECGARAMSDAILLLRVINIYQNGNKVTEPEVNRLKKLGFYESSEDEIKDKISELVQTSFSCGIRCVCYGLGNMKSLVVLYANLDFFNRGMQAINRQTEASRETVSPTVPSLEVMNNAAVQALLFLRTRT